ncbi:MAG TPA: hypothetical protein VJ873_03010, partial [bacterium]|nr:hypothetical protein [bacterium]
KEAAMAPFFLFLFIGLALGFVTGAIKHDDWIDFVADVETSLLGAIIGGMTFVVLGKHMSNDIGGSVLVSLVTAVIFWGVLRRFVGRGSMPAHR